MNKNNRLIGIGQSVIDYKVRKSLLPRYKNSIESVLANSKIYSMHAGGITPNILSAFSQNNPGFPARLLACVGDDKWGRFYQSLTEAQLGNLQITTKYKTGFLVLVLDDKGNIVKRYVEYGAEMHVRVSEREAKSKNGLLVTDIIALSSEDIFSEVKKIIPSIDHKAGKFALNLGGAHSRFGDRHKIQSIIRGLKKDPDFIFGNSAEFGFLLDIGASSVAKSINRIFPNSSLLVITMGNKGTLVRFKSNVFSVNAVRISSKRIIDKIGAGDCLEGTMLAYLYNKSYSQWTLVHVIKAAKTAAFASSLVVQTEESRLNSVDVLKVKRFYSSLKIGNSV